MILAPVLVAVLAASPAGGVAAPAPGAGPRPEGHVLAAVAVAGARSARAKGDVAAERESLSAAVAADPGWDLPRLDLAELVLREAGDARAALALLEAPGLRRDNPRLPRLRAMALEQVGDETSAVRAYGEALALRDDVELRLRRALLLVRIGPLDAAIAEMEQVRAEEPRLTIARSHLADLYEAAGRRAEAEAELRWLAAAVPADPSPLRRLAAFLARGGAPGEADRVEQDARARDIPLRPKRALRPDGAR